MPSLNGHWGCTNGERYTPYGCISSKIATKVACENMTGYWWQESFTNQNGMHRVNYFFSNCFYFPEYFFNIGSIHLIFK